MHILPNIFCQKGQINLLQQPIFSVANETKLLWLVRPNDYGLILRHLFGAVVHTNICEQEGHITFGPVGQIIPEWVYMNQLSTIRFSL